MALVVDSCVLLDVALRDPEFGMSSALFLENIRQEGLVICPVSVVEIAPQFDGTVSAVREFARILGASTESEWLQQDTEVAAMAWSRYVSQKRAGKAGGRPVADILIGAFAARFGGLVTRNLGHFGSFFPGLKLLEPTLAKGPNRR